MKPHDASKLTQVSSDGLRLNLVLLKLLDEKRKYDELDCFIDIGTYGLHIFQKSF